MFKIGDFSKLTFVSIRMLRYYDEIDLFKPIKIDDFTNYRYYSAKQIPELNKIVYLRNLGLKADEIRIIIHEKNELKQKELLLDKRIELEKQIIIDKNKLTHLKKFIENYNMEENKMKYDVVIKDVPSYQVVSLRTKIPQYNSEGELWGSFMGLLYTHNIKFHGMCYAMFFEEDITDGVDIEIGNEVIGKYENVDGLVFKELPEIKQALTMLITGNYEPHIQEGFNHIALWLEENNYEFAGPSRTVYLRGPGEEKNPENYLTEIILPIKKRG